MKKRWKLLLTLGLALVAVVLFVYLGMATQPTVPNNVKHHKETGTLTTQECINCHGDKRSEVGFNTKIYTAHKRHNMSVYLRFNLLTPTDNDGDGLVDEDQPDGIDMDDVNGDGIWGPAPDAADGLVDEDWVEPECAKCHQETDGSLGQVVTNEVGEIHPKKYTRLGSYEGGWIDPLDDDGDTLVNEDLLDGIDNDGDLDTDEDPSDRVARKQVDPRFCVSCHGEFRTTGASPAKQAWGTPNPHLVNGISRAVVDPRGCTTCHKVTGPATPPQVEHRLVPYVNLRYASTSISCLKCHGGYAWYDVEEMNYLPGAPSYGFPPYWPQQP